MSKNILFGHLPGSGEFRIDAMLTEVLGARGYTILPRRADLAPGQAFPTQPCYQRTRLAYDALAGFRQDPSVRCIYLQRDLRDVAALLADHLLSQGAPTVPIGFDRRDTLEMVLSNNLVRLAREAVNWRLDPQVLVISFEDFNADPETAFRRIAEHCELELAASELDDLLARHLATGPVADTPREPPSGLAGDYRPGLHKPYFDPTLAELFRIFLGNEQIALGYRLDDLPAQATPASRQLNFFQATRRPYYICAPDYRQSSAGVRGLHYLCHALNELGEEAYLTPAQTLNPSLRTPLLTDHTLRRHFLEGRQPIAVYPEVMAGNPFEAPVVARWLLNRPGHIGGDTTYRPTDLLFYFARWCLPEGMKGLLLNLPTVDTAIFNNLDNPQDGQRQGACYFANKYLGNGGSIAPEIRQAAASLGLESPKPPREMAAILRQTEVLYCYELSSIIPEALACGCPVLIVPSDYWSEHGNPEILTVKGIALASEPDALARAKTEVVEYQCISPDAARYYWWQVERFVTVTQAAAPAIFRGHGVSRENLWLMPRSQRSQHLPLLDSVYADKVATASPDRKAPRASPLTLSATDLRLLTQRGMGRSAPPLFELLVVDSQSNRPALAATLKSLSDQIHAHFRVRVISADSGPQGGDARFQWLPAGDDHWRLAAAALLDSRADWCGILRSGDRLARNALNTAAEFIAGNPGCCALYTDEDLIDGDGGHGEPRYFPDFDLDLLRSGIPPGGLLLARRETWAAAGGWRELPCGLDRFDAALRLAEISGDAAFGHIPGALLHRHTNNAPILPDDPKICELRRLILKEHLARSAIAADVEDGLQPRLLQVRYHLASTPRISLAILTKDNADGLQRCVTSILEKTDYPDFELLVIDNGSSEAAARRYLDDLTRAAPGLIRVIAFDRPYNPAAMCNAAAGEASGELLVFLHDDIEALHHDWLANLARQCLRPGVAIAGARLLALDGTIEEAGLLPLQAGLTEPALRGRPANEIDALDRLHSVRRVSAVSAACMMVRRDIYLALGGMDAQGFPNRMADIDFCLRARSNSQAIVWTPFATLFHDSDRSSGGKRGDNDALLARWGKTLARDPHFNPYLALTGQQFEPETDPALIPDPVTWHPLPNVFGIAPTEGTPGQKRLTEPLVEATGHGIVRGRVGRAFPAPVTLKRLETDVVVCPSRLDDRQLRELANYRRLVGCRIVMDIDDGLEGLPPDTSAIAALRDRLLRLAPRVDRLTTGSPALASLLGELQAQLLVIPDTLAASRWADLETGRRNAERPRVGWHGRPEDLALIAPVVAETASQVDWIFLGPHPEPLAGTARERHQAVSYTDFPAKLASLDLDLAICPLATSALNECRGFLPLLEYGALGIPVITTRLASQPEQLPVTRVGNHHQEWIGALREHIHDLGETRRRGEQFQTHVRTHWMLANHLEHWLKAWIA